MHGCLSFLFVKSEEKKKTGGFLSFIGNNRILKICSYMLGWKNMERTSFCNCAEKRGPASDEGRGST